jgi:hypothetical protein
VPHKSGTSVRSSTSRPPRSAIEQLWSAGTGAVQSEGSGGDDGDVVGAGSEGGGYGEERVFGADFAGDQGTEGAEAVAGSRQAAAGSVGGLFLVPADAAFGAVRGDDEVDVDGLVGEAPPDPLFENGVVEGFVGDDEVVAHALMVSDVPQIKR